MSASLGRSRSRARSTGVWAAVLAGSVVVGVLATSDPESQAVLVVAACGLLVVGLWAPRAATRDGAVSSRFLVGAFLVHLVASELRYAVIKIVYKGLTDAITYMKGGSYIAADLLAGRPVPFPEPGTDAMQTVAAGTYLVFGDFLRPQFLLYSILAFFASWLFYRAFRISFPEGDARLFAWLIFLFPTMWYWPASLGKDALVVFGLAVTTYGFALVFRVRYARGFVLVALGLFVTGMIRPPVAMIPVVAGVVAFLLRPARAESPQMQAIAWLIVVPALAAVAVLSLGAVKEYSGRETLTDIVQTERTREFSEEGSGSNFEPPDLLTLGGPFVAVTTSTLRPFPWEAGGLLPALASLEMVFLLGLYLWRAPQIVRGVRAWRTNGMVVYALAAYLGMCMVLSVIGNFGILARQRVVLLPFLFILLAMVKRPSRRQQGVRAVRSTVPAA